MQDSTSTTEMYERTIKSFVYQTDIFGKSLSVISWYLNSSYSPFQCSMHSV